MSREEELALAERGDGGKLNQGFRGDQSKKQMAVGGQ